MMTIDLVIPIVFAGDAVWRREYQRQHTGDAAQNVRWRSWDTEELLVRCCTKYMPWLHRIYILLARESQVQPWMRKGAVARLSQPEIRIVFHREFMPAYCLPCFASPCMEMFLHRIPGLSEHFIYGNDDMFPLSPLQPDDFFRPAAPGSSLLVPCQRFKEKPLDDRPGMFQRKCLTQQNMVGKPFGLHFEGTRLDNGHTLAPLLKSTCEAVWQRHGDEIRRWLSPLRRTDHSYNHYIYALYQHFSGLDDGHAPRRQYIGYDTPTAQLPAIIADPEAGIVCLNDNEHISDWRQRAAVVREAIGRKLGSEG